MNTILSPGDLVLIKDHINLMRTNPLIGANNNQFCPRVPDMSRAYNQELNKILISVCKKAGYTLQEGVYAGVLGPSYEALAETKMIRTLGVDIVGMSTVPETIIANHVGITGCGVSCITNMGAGISDQTLRHEDIKHELLKAMEYSTALLKNSIGQFGRI